MAGKANNFLGRETSFQCKWNGQVSDRQTYQSHCRVPRIVSIVTNQQASKRLASDTFISLWWFDSWMTSNISSFGSSLGWMAPFPTRKGHGHLIIVTICQIGLPVCHMTWAPSQWWRFLKHAQCSLCLVWSAMFSSFDLDLTSTSAILWVSPRHPLPSSGGQVAALLCQSCLQPYLLRLRWTSFRLFSAIFGCNGMEKQPP